MKISIFGFAIAAALFAGCGVQEQDASSSVSSSEEAALVEFRIAVGTGNGSWNTRDTMVSVKVGDTLRIHNDDTVAHQLHTNGAPCGHGPRIAPGASFDCVISRTFDPDQSGALYDHGYGPDAAFWVKAERP